MEKIKNIQPGVNMKNVKFMYNGIKVDGKLFKAHYSRFVPINGTEEIITVYARSYSDGLPQIGAIENDSDMQSDYFDKDRMRIAKGSEFWAEAVEAMAKVEARNLRLRKVAA